MPTDPFHRSTLDSIRLGPSSIGALTGAFIAFVWSGAIVTVLWVLFGLAAGAALGYGVGLVLQRAHSAEPGETPSDEPVF